MDATRAVARHDDAALAQFASDVREFLGRTPRQLPSRYFYDPLGSALFDAICRLPWYRVTRAESRLLETYRAELHRLVAPLSTIVELGPGNGEKLRLLLEAADRERSPLDLHLVDVSSRALEMAEQTLGSLDNVRIFPHVAAYDAGLRQVASQVDAAGRTLVLFLGSNIGNFDPPFDAALLGYVRENLRPGDALLLGTDLVKPARDLTLAYDDPLGVTAAFNRNLLVRINRELGGNFDLDAFAHRAVWNAAASRVEMHLEARSSQHVTIDGAPMELTLRAGERIWTESSYKYRPDDVSRLARKAGFRTTMQWIDEQDAFMLTLAAAV